MRILSSLVVVLVLSIVAGNAGHAGPGPAPKSGDRPNASGKAAAPAGNATQGQAPKSGGPSESGTTGGPQGPGGGQGSSAVNGTGMGPGAKLEMQARAPRQ